MRARGMQVLTDQVRAARPGVVIGGIGDKPHQDTVSGHNEDDTPGVKAEDQDEDDTPEHRALDFMVGPAFSQQDGDDLVHDLTTVPENQARLIYVNWRRSQYHRKNNWQPVPNDDDPHDDHVHASGEADADENVNPWIFRKFGQENQDMTMFVEIATDPTPRPVYKSDGFEYEHLTSGAALAAAQKAGHKVITVPDHAAFDALCGKLRVPVPPVTLTPEQITDIAVKVAAELFEVQAAALRAGANVLDEAAGN